MKRKIIGEDVTFCYEKEFHENNVWISHGSNIVNYTNVIELFSKILLREYNGYHGGYYRKVVKSELYTSKKLKTTKIKLTNSFKTKQ